jgi:Sulfotransferase family
VTEGRSSLEEPIGAQAGGRASDPFSVVLGHVRSGTTMLRAMLDAHPELAIPPEAYGVAPILRLGPTAPCDIDEIVRRFGTDKYFADWQLPIERLETLRTDARVVTHADAVAGLYHLYAAHHGKARYGDKTPSHTQDIELLATSFPQARFVHIVRDGRDVAASVLSLDFGASEFAEASRRWKRKVLRGHRYGLTLGPERYRMIHYEALVADPEAILRSVCEFFGFEFRSEMLSYNERAEQLLEGVRDTGHIQGIRRPPTVGLRDWHVDLAPRQIAVFDEVAGDALDELGYPRSGLRRSWRARAVAASTEVRIRARKFWRNTPRRVRRNLPV